MGYYASPHTDPLLHLDLSLSLSPPTPPPPPTPNPNPLLQLDLSLSLSNPSPSPNPNPNPSPEPLVSNKKPRINKPTITLPNPPPELPSEFRERITQLGGSDPKLVLQKALFKSDVSKLEARLMLTAEQCSRIGLTEAEVARAEERDGGGKNIVGIEVKVIEPRNGVQVKNMVFKKWVKNYVLVGKWNELTRDNKLNEGDIIQVWSFRCCPGDQLAFALVKLNP